MIKNQWCYITKRIKIWRKKTEDDSVCRCIHRFKWLFFCFLLCVCFLYLFIHFIHWGSLCASTILKIILTIWESYNRKCDRIKAKSAIVKWLKQNTNSRQIYFTQSELKWFWRFDVFLTLRLLLVCFSLYGLSFRENWR